MEDWEARSQWNSLFMLVEFPMLGVLVVELPHTQNLKRLKFHFLRLTARVPACDHDSQSDTCIWDFEKEVHSKKMKGQRRIHFEGGSTGSRTAEATVQAAVSRAQCWSGNAVSSPQGSCGRILASPPDVFSCVPWLAFWLLLSLIPCHPFPELGYQSS